MARSWKMALLAFAATVYLVCGTAGTSTTTTSSTSTMSSTTTTSSTATTTTTTTSSMTSTTTTTSSMTTTTTTTSSATTTTTTSTTSTASTTTTSTSTMTTTTTSTTTTTTTQLGTLTVEMEVAIENPKVFQEFLETAQQSANNWFTNALTDLIDIMPTFPDLPDWNVVSIEMVGRRRLAASVRRLSTGEFAITLDAVYVVSDSTFDLESLVSTIYSQYPALINSKISSTSWSVTEVTYVSVQDDFSGTSQIEGDVPSWSSLSNATSESTESGAEAPRVATWIWAAAMLPAAAVMAAL